MLCCGDGSCDAGLIKSLMVYYVILVLVLASAFWQGEFILVVARGCFQIGSILGPTVVQMYSTSLGIPTIYFLGACCMLILQGTIYVCIKVYGVSSKDGKKDEKKKEKAGILEGLQLFYDHNYIKGIFAISWWEEEREDASI